MNVAPMGLDHLEGPLARFGPAVGEKSSLQPAYLSDPFGERSLIFVVEEVRRVDQARRVLLCRANDARMIVAERVHADAGNEVQIAFPVYVPNVRAVAAPEHKR